MDEAGLNIQNGFFNQVRKDRTRVTLILNNGQRISGLVKSFDKFTLLLDTRQGEQMVFKHAISTISVFHPAEGAGSTERAPKAAAKERPAPETAGFGNFMDLERKKP